MRDRLASLSDEARSIRTQMPREFEPDVERIQQQMQRLGERLSELSGVAVPRAGVTGSGANETMPRAGGDEDARVARAAPDEVILLGGPRKADDLWTEDSARALTRFYESGEAFLGCPKQEAQPATPAAMPRAAMRQSFEAALSGQKALPSASQQAGPRASPPASERSPEENKSALSPVEPGWLDRRLTEIAQRIEQSLAEIRPESSLLTLGRRFDQLETRVTTALGGMATRADLKELRIAEAQIDEISAQLDQLRRQFVRLDAIDAHLGTLAAQLSDDRLTRLFASGMGTSRDASRLDSISAQLATIAGQLSQERLADLISQNAVRGADLEEMATAAAHKAAARFADREAKETQTRDIGEVRGLLESLINERRHSDDNNASMLETMQQAIIRVLDRIDALELTQQEAHASQPDAYAPVPPQRPDAEPAEPGFQTVQTQHEPVYGAPPAHSYAQAREEPPMVPPVQGVFTSPPFDLDAAFASDRDSAPSNYAMPDPSAQPMDVLRHDLIADAHRAKLKAASKKDSKIEPDFSRVGEISAPRDRVPPAKARTRRSIFRSPRVLMSILTLLAMIPAALFFMPRKPAPDRVVPAAAQTLPLSEEGTTGSNDAGMPDATPNSQDGEDTKPPADGVPSKQSQQLTPDAVPGAREYEDVGNPTPNTKERRLNSASLSSPERLAFLSGQAASASAKPTPAALMEARVIGNDRVPAPGNVLTGESAPARLPPPTVGPYSLRLAAAKGDAAAQFEVASRIAEGKGADKDVKDAVQWYQRSAASGFPMAQFRLGNLYERGIGVKKDLARAQVWYSRAAELGNVKAMHNLAVLMAAHGGPTPDYPAAAKWFGEAASHGLQDSQYNLAMLYEGGLGVPKDAKEAYKWLVLAAKSGDAEAKSRRDALKAALSPGDRAAAEGAVEEWRAKPSDAMANDSRVAGQAWRQRPRMSSR